MWDPLPPHFAIRRLSVSVTDRASGQISEIQINAGSFLFFCKAVRNSSSSSSSSWWQESEVTLSFKIYFLSVSFSRRTLMWTCGGLLSTGAWSKENTTGIFALWENTLWSHVSSNRPLMALTWGKKGLSVPVILEALRCLCNLLCRLYVFLLFC